MIETSKTVSQSTATLRLLRWRCFKPVSFTSPPLEVTTRRGPCQSSAGEGVSVESEARGGEVLPARGTAGSPL